MTRLRKMMLEELERRNYSEATTRCYIRTVEDFSRRTAFRCPWQNGVAERWAGSCRRDLLDHVIILNERHLKRLMSAYLLYYHEDRTHLGLAKDTRAGRPAEIRSTPESKIQSFPRLGGLHHRYAVAALTQELFLKTTFFFCYPADVRFTCSANYFRRISVQKRMARRASDDLEELFQCKARRFGEPQAFFRRQMCLSH